MNPYTYIDPPDGNEYSSSPINLAVMPLSIRVKTFQSQTKHFTKSTYLLFLAGLLIGIIFTNLIGFNILNSASCSDIGLSLELPSNNYFDKLNTHKVPNSLLRNKKNLIYIGVMTANKYLSSRAKSVFETWGKHLPGKISFFSSEFSQTSENIPLVKLKGVTDIYPPQKKSFMMLKHMFDNHINDFEFFMRADDDLYVNTERLEKFLKSLNSSRAYYIGQAGIGNENEFGHLALNEQENFCMGGPGVILSKYTLEKIAPHVKECLKNMRSTHEDVEVGRCVQKFAKIPCTWSFEMQNIFYHNYSGANAFTGSLKQKEVHRAITMHPIKDPFHLRRVDSYVKSLMIKEKEYELVQAMRERLKFAEEFSILLSQLDNTTDGIYVSHIGLNNNFGRLAKNSHRIIVEQDFYSKNVHQLKDENPRHRPPSFINEGMNDVIREVMETINRVSKERGRIIDFKEVLYGYHYNNPMISSDYTLDLLLLYKKYRGKKMTVPVRRHAYIQVPYGLLYVRESPISVSVEDHNTNFIGNLVNLFLKRRFPFTNKNEKQVALAESSNKMPKRINFVLPLSGRFSTFQRFMEDFKKVCLESGENVNLIVVSFQPKPEEQDARNLIDTLLYNLQSEYPYASMHHVRSQTPFARAMALEIGSSKTSPNDLLLFIDVDITFTREALDRIRMHTIEGKQIYFPIVYSEYNPKILRNRNNSEAHFVINEEVGYWRAFGYGIAAMYQSDLRNVGGFNTTIIGWGKEDVDLFEKVLKFPKSLKVFRAPDPDLIHIFHHADCDHSLEAEQFKMCQGSRYSTYASPHTLVKIIKRQPEILEIYT